MKTFRFVNRDDVWVPDILKEKIKRIVFLSAMLSSKATRVWTERSEAMNSGLFTQCKAKIICSKSKETIIGNSHSQYPTDECNVHLFGIEKVLCITNTDSKIKFWNQTSTVTVKQSMKSVWNWPVGSIWIVYHQDYVRPHVFLQTR